MRTLYRRSIRVVAVIVTLTVGMSVGEAAETSADVAEGPGIVVGSEALDEHILREQVCDRLAGVVSVACPGDDSQTEMATGPRYRAAIEPGEDADFSLGIAKYDRPDVGIVDRRLTLDDGLESGMLATEIERNIVDSGIDGSRTETPLPYWGRTAGWQTVALTAGTIWYFAFGDLNSKDWDYAGLYSDDPELELRPQSEVWRDFGGWRLDDNVMFLNTPLHPMAGGAYYLLSRGNNLGMWQSILVANLSSFFWEAGIEHMEVVSLNDLILTGVGGIPLGEIYHQLGQFFRSAEPTWYNQTLAWVFGMPSQLNDLIDGTGPLYVGERNELGWPEETWHQVELRPGFSAASAVGDRGARYDGEIAASAELVRLPEFRRSGEYSDWMTGPLRTRLDVDFAANGEDVYSWGLRGELDFAGFYRHRVTDDVGTSFFVGSGLAFDHQQHRFAEGLDRYGLVHLPGLRLDGSWLTGPADVRVRYGLYPDFSSIDSVAYPTYHGETGRRAGRTVLDNERYYMGWGVSNVLEVEVDASPVHLHWDGRLHWVRSMDSRDRFFDDEERFGPDLDGYLTLTDTVWHHEVGAMIDTPISSLKTGLVGEYRSRAGTVDDGDDVWEADRRDLRGLGVVQMTY